MTRFAPAMRPMSVVSSIRAIAASTTARSYFPVLTARLSDALIWRQARSIPTSSTSVATTGRPATATDSAIPAPMKPAPTTATFVSRKYSCCPLSSPQETMAQPSGNGTTAPGATIRPSEAVLRGLVVALEGEREQAIEQLRVGEPAGGEERSEDARVREPGHRVELVDEHLARPRRRSRRGPARCSPNGRTRRPRAPDALAASRDEPSGDDELHPARACTSPRSRTSPARRRRAGSRRAARRSEPRCRSRALDLETRRGRLDDRQRVVANAHAAQRELGRRHRHGRSRPRTPAVPA